MQNMFLRPCQVYFFYYFTCLQRLCNAVNPRLSFLNEMERRKTGTKSAHSIGEAASSVHSLNRCSDTVITNRETKHEGVSTPEKDKFVRKSSTMPPDQLEGLGQKPALKINKEPTLWLKGTFVAPTWSWSWTSTNFSPFPASVSMQNSPRIMEHDRTEGLRQTHTMIRSKSAPSRLQNFHAAQRGL